MNDSIATKVCTRCKAEKPATLEFFGPYSKGQYGLLSRCRACKLEISRQYHQTNAGAIRERMRKRYENLCTEAGKPYTPTAISSEEPRPERKRFGKSTPEEVLVRRRLRHKMYATKHPEKVRAKQNRRRARVLGASGNHTEHHVQQLFEWQKGLCWWCSKPVGDKYHVDHVLPLSKGGSNGPENLVISCAGCNHKKCDKMPWEFNGRLL